MPVNVDMQCNKMGKNIVVHSKIISLCNMTKHENFSLLTKKKDLNLYSLPVNKDLIILSDLLFVKRKK